MGTSADPDAMRAAADRAHPSGMTRRERRHQQGRIARYFGINERWATAFDLVFFVVLAIVGSWVLQTFLVSTFYIPSESMVPTLLKNDRILVNKLSTEPGRGDVVVFKAVRTGPGEPRDLVKRVVGLPGETIEAHDGQVFINGKALDEPYLPKGTRTDPFGPTLKDASGAPLLGANAIPVTKIPSNSYFMMGDNRGNSQDSRYWGVLPQSNIIGEAVLRFWPVDRVSTL